jgi:hypothetical protein
MLGLMQVASSHRCVGRCTGQHTVSGGLLLGLMLLLPAHPLKAADQNHQFAALGGGVVSCARFLEARQAKDKEYFMLGGWVDGYLTARNQLSPETFTLTPWQSTDLLMGLLAQYCGKNPDAPLLRGVMLMAEALKTQRLKSASERVKVRIGSLSHDFFREVLVQMQTRLTRAGYYKGSASGDFNAETIAAMKQFQRANGLEASGFPDQKTLLKLMNP